MPIDVSPSIRARTRRRRMPSATLSAMAIASGRRRRRSVKLAGIIADPAGGAPLVEPLHEAGVFGPVGGVGPDPRGRPADALERRAGVQERDQPGPGAREIRREQERVVLADDSIDSVRGIGPVDIEADQGIVDRSRAWRSIHRDE